MTNVGVLWLKDEKQFFVGFGIFFLSRYRTNPQDTGVKNAFYDNWGLDQMSVRGTLFLFISRSIWWELNEIWIENHF